jgi:DNA polymerase III subunit epsilon
LGSREAVMDFVAIDFETANEKRSSPCAIGLVVIQDGKCVERFSRLICPPECRFSSFNTAIHGISENDVRGEPEFCDIWKDLQSYFDGNLVLAHNASFDMSVLRNTLKAYDIPFPTLTYNCTRIIARQAWPGFITYGLAFLADQFGIPFIHHNAEEDALACSEIARRACEEQQASTIEELGCRLEIAPGELFPGGYRTPKAMRQKGRSTGAQKHIKTSDLSPRIARHDPGHPLFSQLVVFTGTLHSMVREEAMQRVVDAGGFCGNNLTKDTDYLVFGDFDLRTLNGQHKSSKLRRAEALVAEGSPLEIVSERDFLSMLLS